MRRLAPLALVVLSGCSLIRTTMPEPVGTWSKRSECADSAVPPVIDALLGATGALVAVGGAAEIAQGTNSAGTSTVPLGAGTLGVGVLGVGLFVTSAIIGGRRVSSCRTELAAWDAAHPGQRPEDRADMLARQALRCPVDPLQRRDLDFARGDARHDTHPWAEQEVSGCGRVTWCGDDNGRKRCGPPADLELAISQLAIETACPVPSIEQQQFFNVNTQITYRLRACGRTYTCSVPLLAVTDKSVWTGQTQEHDRVAGSRFGSQITCHPALDEQPAPPPPPALEQTAP